MKQETRSRLKGELALAVDKALQEGEDIQFEISSYRGHGIVVTDTSLMLVVGGVLAGLKAHEQHIHRIPLDKLVSVGIESEPPGCLLILGVPPVKLKITTAHNFMHDKKWDTLEVDYTKLHDAAGLVAYLHEKIGERRAGKK